MIKFLFLKTTVLLALLLVTLLPVEFIALNVHANNSSVNTGFEPWYHYIGGIVNSGSGNLFFSAKDISIRGRGFNLKIVRSYNSFNGEVDGPFGYGWTFNYYMRLFENLGSVTLFDGDGSSHIFSNTGGGNYSPPPGVHLKLTKNPDGTFILRFKDGVSWNFDSLGKPSSIVDKNGNQLTFTYEDEKLLMVSDDSGLAINFDYNAENRVVRVSDPMGRQITYEYDANGNLVRITDAMGYSILYFYSGHLLESVVNRFGGMLSFEYSYDKVVGIEASLYDYNSGLSYGSFKLYSIDYDSQNVVVTNSRGFKTTVQINEIGNPTNFIDALGGISSMGWDNNMNMISFTNAKGYTWNYTYDAYGNILSEKNPLGYSTLFGWNITDTETRYISLIANVTNALGFTTSFNYDDSGNLIQIIDALENSCYFSYDIYGNVIEFVDFRGYPTLYSYDSHGHLVNSTDVLGNISLYSYDLVGRLTNYTDANGHMTTFVYDDNDRLIRIIDPSGGETQYVYNEEGSLVSIIDPNGHQMNYSNNIINRVDRMEYGTGFGESYVYDRRGNVIKTIDANGAETLYSYDALDRLVSITDVLGNTETYTYDAVGNLVSKTDKNGNTMLFEYDELNRRIRVVDSLGSEARCEYDAAGRIISLQDANGHITNYEYDLLNRLTKIVDASGNETRFEYDANGNLINLTDANGHVSSYEYDPLNRLVRVVDPDSSETRLGYDAVGNNIEVIKPDGVVITYEYDPLNRLVSVLYPDGSNITVKYDLGGRVVEVANNGIGFGDITYYQYNERDLVTSIRVDYGGMFNKTISYSYDPNGNRIMMDAEGEITTYIYNLLGQLISIQDPSGDVTTFEYDKVGRRTRVNYPNGMYSVYTYDATGNLLRLTNKKSNGDIASSFTYSYDPVGNRLNITRENGDVTSYEYDSLNRLIRVMYPDGPTVRYVYDAVGNRLQEIVNETYITFYTYDANDRLLTAGGINYYYDPCGNLIAKEEGSNITFYEYDFEDRLTGAILPSGLGINYTYSPMGTRLSKTDSSGTVFYFYDFEDILMELDETGMSKAMYVHGPGIDDPLSMFRDENKSYYHFDGLGSVATLTDFSENIVGTYEYDAFGIIVEETGVVVNPYRFTGREYDEETGLYYYRARYYDSKTGRFTTIDPIRGCVFLPQTYNPYVYVMNNPVNFVDPDGKGWFIVVLAAAAAIYIGHKIYKAFKGTKEAMDNNLEKGKRNAKILEKVSKGEATEAEMKEYERNRRTGISEAGKAGFDMYTSTPGTLATGPVPTSAKEAIGAAAGSAAQDAMAPSNPGRIKDKEELIKSNITRIDDRFSRIISTIPIVPTNYATPHSDVGFASTAESIFTLENLNTLGSIHTFDMDLLESHGGPSITSIKSHDISVTNVMPSKTIIGQGFTLNVNVTVRNQGSYTETFNLTIYANSSLINQTLIFLATGKDIQKAIKWNTTGFAKGNYTIWACAGPVQGETDTADNTFTYGIITITIKGDVDGDFDVDIYDVVKITCIYGSTRSDPEFNPNSDLDDDGEITIYDVVRCTSHYGDVDP